MGSNRLVAAFLSALIPGAGQLYARRPLRALAFLLPAIALGYASYRFATLGALEIAVLFLRPEFLSGALVVNVAVLLWRIAAVVDAYRITESRADQSWMPITLALLLLFVAIPHMIGWSYGVRTIAALETVFVAAPVDVGPLDTGPPHVSHLDPLPDPGPAPLPDPEEVIAEPDSPRNSIFRPGFGDPDAIAARGNILSPPTPVAPFLPFSERENKERLTILLVGADAGPGREGLRTDTMIVATIELATGKTALFGLPRNFKLIPLPHNLKRSFVGLEERVIEKDLTDEDEDGFPDLWVDLDGDGIPDEPEFVSCECFPTMLNKVHRYTQDWTRTYPNTPDPGLAALKDIVANLLDLPIDNYVMVKMEGFVKAIDALGGVNLLVKTPFHVTVSSPEDGVPKATVNVEPGMNRLDGLESLAYVRWRRGSSDYSRMQRQRCLLRAVTAQANTANLIRSFPTLLDLVKESVSTDIPLTFLPDLIRIAGTADFDNVATVGLAPPTYSAGRTPAKYPIPDVDRIRWKVRDVLENGVSAQSRTGQSECAA